MSEKTFKGGCLCGAVSYTVEGPIGNIVCCHCTQCRKQTGHHFAAPVISRSGFRMTGESALSWYQSSADARRGFCSKCGSTLFWEKQGLETIDILAGGIDGPLGTQIDVHVYVGDKGDYYEICGDARQYPAGR